MPTLKTLTTSPLGTNTYFYTDSNDEGVIIDPGMDPVAISRYLEGNEAQYKYILLTHSHFDHVLATKAVQKLTGAKVVIHEAENPLLESTNYTEFGNFPHPKADITVNDDSVLSVGQLEFRFLHTPGHTVGSMCIISDNIMFSGDTLFYGTCGRWDLPTGDMNTLFDTFKNKLYPIQKDYKVYPGHMRSTTLQYEKEHNEVFLSLL